MQTIGRYQLLDVLGRGGMGIVYKGFDPLIQRTVAVKVISTQLDAEPELRERFFREARAAGQLSHPNIITIHDLGEDNGQPYLAMEFLEGQDLQARLRSAEPLSLGHRVAIMAAICEGLAYAHERGIVHRDIKPANIFLTTAGPVKILDFGLARLVSSELTKSHMMLGTMNYMAPEQIRAERADHRADIFSAGTVFYELLSGRRAFVADSFAGTIYQILQETPEPLTRINADLPPALVAIVDRAMAKPREERYQEIGEMLRELLVAQQSIPAAVSASRSGPGHPAGTGGVTSAGRAGEILLPSAAPSRSPAAVGSAPYPGGGAAPGPAPSGQDGTRRLQMGPLSMFIRTRRWAVPVMASAILLFAASAVWMFSSRQAVGPERVDLRAQSAVVPDGHSDAGRAPADDVLAADRARAVAALEAHEYQAAASYARQVLARAPDDAEARRVLDEAEENARTLEERARQARDLYAAGKHDEAGRAAGEVLRVDPANEEAQALLTRMATVARRSADEALGQMEQARARADAAGAGELASEPYRAARAAEATARQLHRSGRFPAATARLYEATGLYRSAEVAAGHQRQEQERARAAEDENRLRARRELEQRLTAARRDYDDQRTRAQQMGADVRAAAQFRDAAALAASARTHESAGDLDGALRDLERAAITMRQARQTAQETMGAEETSAGRAPPAPPAAGPTPEPPAAEVAHQAITDLLARYTAALRNRDMAALKRVWPTLGGAQESAIRAEFDNARELEVTLLNPQIEAAGTRATATARRQYRLTTRDGQRLQSETRTTVHMRRNGAAWLIDDVRHEVIQ